MRWAVEPLSQDSRHRRLTCSPGPGKEIGMGNSAARQAILQRLDNTILPYYIGENLWAPFSI
jgi:hypothetical protein